jgi:hypothetical protein
MKRLSILICAFALLAGPAAYAQQLPILPHGSEFNAPLLPSPPPPPKIEVPAIPQVDAPPSQPSVQAAPQSSFGDRINSCLDEAAAAGLGVAGRAAFSRSCANQ